MIGLRALTKFFFLAILLALPSFALAHKNNSELQGEIDANRAAIEDLQNQIDQHHAVPPSQNSPPIAGFVANCSDLICVFTDGSSDSDGSIAGWSWAFGDGSISTVQSPSYSYEADGSYVVSLTVVDDAGASDSTSQTLAVLGPSIPPSGPWNPAMISAMPPGSWLAYGEPWNTIARNFCDRPFANTMTAWTSGALDEQGNMWMATPGGHGDGCDQSLYRINIETGQPEIVIDHVPLNAQDANGPYSADANGKQIQPRSTHNYNGVHIIDGWLYRASSIVWPTEFDDQNWRVHLDTALVTNSATSWERLPDGGPAYNRMAALDGVTLYGLDHSFCEYDWQTGTASNCDDNRWLVDSAYSAVGGAGDAFWFVDVRNKRSWDPPTAGDDPNSNLQGFFRKIVRSAPGVYAEERTLPFPTDFWNEGLGGYGICIVPTAEGDVPIIWVGSADLFAWMPDNSLVTLSAPGGPADIGGNSRRAYGRWAWSERFQACIGADRVENGLWIYKPDFASAPEPIPPQGNLIFYDDMENPVTIAGRKPTRCLSAAEALTVCGPRAGGSSADWFWGTWPTNPGDRTGPQLVDGALRFTFPSNSEAYAGGYYQVNFIEGLDAAFGPGETLEIQYRWRASCTLIWRDCDPASTGYKQERRWYQNIGGGYTGFKLSILGTGDAADDSWIASSCSAQETVINHGPDHQLRGYHACGYYINFSEPIGDWDYQPHGDNICPWQWVNEDGDTVAGWGNAHPDCYLFDSEVWHTVRMRLDIGEYQLPTASSEPLSRVRIWVQRDGAPEIAVIDHAMRVNFPEPEGEGFGKLWILPYMTTKDPSEAHPEAWVDYDDVTVCSPRCEE